MRHRPRASGTGCPVEFFDNLSRFGGVSEAEVKREPVEPALRCKPKGNPERTRRIPELGVEGWANSILSRFAGVSEAEAEPEPTEPALRCKSKGEILSAREGSP